MKKKNPTLLNSGVFSFFEMFFARMELDFDLYRLMTAKKLNTFSNAKIITLVK